MRRLLTTLALLALALPSPAFARGHFDPTTEFEQHEWVPIHLGALNLSITKAVAYLMIGSALTILLGLVLMRGRTLNRRQTAGELIYDVAQTQVAEQGLPSKAIGRWFPYVATLLLFIFVVNLIGFIPLPLTGEKWHGVPTWGIYAVTSQLSVTLVQDVSVTFAAISKRKVHDRKEFLNLAATISGDSKEEQQFKAFYSDAARTAGKEAIAYGKNCACIFGALVRGKARDLTSLTALSGVRAVDIGGGDDDTLQLQPLLPEQKVTVTRPLTGIPGNHA